MRTTDDRAGETAVGVGVVVVVAGAAAAGANHTDNTAPILAFSAAILVACITGYTTNRRQRRQLDEEAERQRRELEAEAERLERQLAHDRDLRDLDHLRRFIDDAMRAYDELADELAKLARKPPTPQEQKVLLNAGMKLTGFESRFQLRFPRGHPLPTKFGAMVDKMVKLVPVLAATERPLRSEDAKRTDQLRRETGAAFSEFTKEAVKVVGVASNQAQVGIDDSSK